MKIFDIFKRKTFAVFPLVAGSQGGYSPKMVQRPLVDTGNTGRYFLDAQMVKFDAPVRGTIAPNSPRTTGTYLDVTADKTVAYGGMGTIPTTPGRQALVRGFRDGAL